VAIAHGGSDIVQPVDLLHAEHDPVSSPTDRADANG
jgi:hypothetical protein